MVNKILEKISWKTHKWNYSFDLLQIDLHDNQESWGFKFFNLSINYYDHALLAFYFRLPNKTTVKRFSIDHMDFLFLNRPLYKVYDRLNDRELWNPETITTLDKIKIKILNKIFNR
tara:strand:- start:10125 stop:10472 length:348 start_codon:yes stop_codon:yes gene_type:complete